MVYSKHKWSHIISALRWRHNELDGDSDHQPHDCLLNRLFGCRSKKTSKLRVTGLCAGNSPGTGEFSAQMASNAENVSIWWRHHGTANLVQRKRQSITYGLRSFSCLGTRLWNTLVKDYPFSYEIHYEDLKKKHGNVGWSKPGWRFFQCLIITIVSFNHTNSFWYTHIYVYILFLNYIEPL